MEQGSNSSFWQKPAIRFLYGNVYGLLRTLRPRQWIKNGLVFMALLFDQKLTNGPLLLRTTAAFILFCMVSSTVYIINDLADIEKDKLTRENAGVPCHLVSSSPGSPSLARWASWPSACPSRSG
jgi:4-hydroxybenzoate polyprenyltransferase